MKNCADQYATFDSRARTGLKDARTDWHKEHFFMQERKIKKTDPDTKYRSVLAASTLAGNSVRNSAGDDLGKIDELMIHIPSGKVAYAVLSFGGVLRIGNKLFAVPWSALKVDEDEKCF